MGLSPVAYHRADKERNLFMQVNTVASDMKNTGGGQGALHRVKNWEEHLRRSKVGTEIPEADFCSQFGAFLS